MRKGDVAGRMGRIVLAVAASTLGSPGNGACWLVIRLCSGGVHLCLVAAIICGMISPGEIQAVFGMGLSLRGR